VAAGPSCIASSTRYTWARADRSRHLVATRHRHTHGRHMNAPLGPAIAVGAAGGHGTSSTEVPLHPVAPRNSSSTTAGILQMCGSILSSDSERHDQRGLLAHSKHDYLGDTADRLE